MLDLRHRCTAQQQLNGNAPTSAYDFFSSFPMTSASMDIILGECAKWEAREVCMGEYARAAIESEPGRPGSSR